MNKIIGSVTTLSKLRKRALLCPLLFIVAGCGGSFQAPVQEQGEAQVNQAPIIARTSSNENGGAVIERSSASTSSNRSTVAVISQSSAGQIQRRPAETRSVIARSQPAPANNTNHRVRSGDTLYSIAFQHDLDFRSLALANNLRSPYTIYVGQDINLVVNNVASSAPSSVVNSSVGTEVSNNSVARAQGGTSRSGGVLRQAIQSRSATPAWDWPHDGRVVRGFRGTGDKGLDIQGQLGDAVLAAGAGDVVYAGRGVQGSGNLIIIRHSDRYLSAYAHNSVMLVEEGASVTTGDKIAEVGETPAGDAMLHFEIRLDGKSVDPNGVLPGR